MTTPFFDDTRPRVEGRAPGRLDVMGGIADYSGSLVLQLPIAAEARASVQWCGLQPPAFIARTTNQASAAGSPDVRITLTDLLQPYAVVRDRFARDRAGRWAAYLAGAITVLHHERGFTPDRGIRCRLDSNVPAGKGVSSSAAIEVATMRALAGLFDLPIEGRDLALLCQRVENLVVGAPCGVMDQMTAACGAPHTLLALLCQPAELEAPVPLPSNVAFVGIDSGIRHAVTGSDYASVRVGAFMGYRILADLAGLPVAVGDGSVRIHDSRWHGYLANVTPAEWESRFRDDIPERLSGREFLRRYQGTTDTVTTVDPDRTYAIRQPTAHPIYEHDRVRRFRALLQSVPSGADLPDEALAALGSLMDASHESYGACGLGSDGTDMLVHLVRAAGPAEGLFGAKITGGGSGGTVAVLARRAPRSAVDAITDEYAAATGRAAAVIA